MERPPDLAGSAYWDRVWARRRVRRAGRFSYFSHALNRLFTQYARPGERVLEIGCADSAWVPHLSARGCDVWGIDYSPGGLELVEERLRASGGRARLVEGDALGSNGLPTNTFDLVYSLGVVEHFSEPLHAVRRFAAYARPGGLVLTLVPNLAGIWGQLQSRLDAEVFALHVPYDRKTLDGVHAAAGLQPIAPARYLGVIGLTLLHSPTFAARAPRLSACATAAAWITQQAIAWPAGLVLGRYAESAWASSHVVGVYARPAHGWMP